MAFLIPIGIALVAANLGANLQQAQEDRRAEARAREAAERERIAREEQIAEQARAAVRAAEIAKQAEQQRIQHERDQLKIVTSILDCCKSGEVEQIPAYLRKLDGPHFRSLGQAPLTAAKDEETLNAIDRMLYEEREQRRNVCCSMRNPREFHFQTGHYANDRFNRYS